MLPLDEFTSFLLKSSGTSGQIFDSFLKDKVSDGPIFFSPYKSAPDLFFRTTSIFTAPVCFAIYTTGFCLGAVFIACQSLVELVSVEPEKAKESAGMTVTCLLLMGIALLSMLMSPFVNLIDLIGGGVTTVLRQCRDEECNDRPSCL